MKVLLVGAGAREHIIAEQLSKSAALYSIMPKKHPGIASLSEKFLIADPTDKETVGQWCIKEGIDLAFVSPDALLAAGVTDIIADAGIAVASPLREAARIEWDKAYARNLMLDNSIPGLPEFEVVDNEGDARSFIKDAGEVAVKPIGLTGGKGVRIMGEHFASAEETMTYVKGLIEKDGSVLLEERLDGEEITVQSFSDGSGISLMPPVQDHKRAFVGDRGPNTGGMGSYSTGKLLPFMEQKDLDSAKEIMEKTVAAMKSSGNPFKGVLYGQFMLTSSGLRVIEFNARFGDPEAMNVLTLLRTQLADIFQSIHDGKLVPPAFSDQSTVVKYLVPEGYPEAGKKDQKIEINEKGVWDCGSKLYFGSVYGKGDEIFTTASRTAALVARADSLGTAEERAECAARHVSGPVWHRPDIGTSALVKKRMEHVRRLKS